MGTARFQARAVRAALVAWLALFTGGARAVPRALQRCDGDPAACAWAAVYMGMPSRQCARPAPTCARWFNGCARATWWGCRRRAARCACFRARRRRARHPPLPDRGRAAGRNCASSARPRARPPRRVPERRAGPTVAVRARGRLRRRRAPAGAAPAARRAGALRSAVAPARPGRGADDRHRRGRPRPVGPGARRDGDRRRVVRAAPERGAPYDPSFADAPVATFVTEGLARSAGGLCLQRPGCTPRTRTAARGCTTSPCASTRRPRRPAA